MASNSATTDPLVQNTKFEELCRLCGSKTDMFAVHIFDEEGTFSDLGKKIYSCLQLQIHQQDELPKLLCNNCIVKLEIFWDFKDRSFRTEQLLIELYKQLKTGGPHCVVSLDENGMILPVSNHHQIIPDNLPTDIDISQLGRAKDPEDYSIILNHADLNAPHLENLELSNHDLNGQNHGQEKFVVLQTANERFTGDNLNLMHQQLMLAMPMYHPDALKHNFAKTEQDETLDSMSYGHQKNPLVLESNLSDNSLGVEVDSNFDRIISYSSDSQMEKIQQEDESDSNPNIQNSDNVSDVIRKAEFLLDGDTMQPREEFSNLTSTSLETQNQTQFFKYQNDDIIYNSENSETIKQDNIILNYKEEISLESFEEGLKNEDSNSLDENNCDDTSLKESIEDHDSGSLSEIGILSNEIPGNKPQEESQKSSPKAGGKVCTVCGKVYKSNYKLTEHMTKHTGERPHKCKTCNKGFRSKIGLSQHEATHTGNFELRCPTCGKGFQCKSYLMVHQRVHSDVKPFPCKTCGLSFKTKQSLLDHTNRHLGVKPFSCSICNRGFITKSLREAHEKTHAGIDNRKYSCKVCQKKFVSKSYLQTHFRIHTGEKSFICEVCGKGFLTSVDLKIHLTMHTGEKTYVCEMCGKAFARRDALKCHRRMHTGERPYSCDVCGRTFTQFTPMANHKRQHTGEKPFSCKICNKNFVTKSSLASHQKKHPKEDTNSIIQKKGDGIVKVEALEELFL
ncbi:unnamed protein product [Ceutorhynchus assimilis]|uniref:Uncharacterized protein n=1 Tax=Ceutorhynchus assimilis TaxID=467358 RepID=A0A9N9MUS0_9CUCU|nr:unnamed protein product [Ceutorhynchus assimilis]